MTSDHNGREQRLLRLSIYVTLASSAASVVFGLWLSSKAIVFDGIYEVIDAGMTAIALFATRLIARGEDSRFQYGYWHLEPMLALVNGIVLFFVCLYALVDGVNGLITGGRAVQFGAGVIYAGLSAILSFALYAYVRRGSRGLGSQLLDLDARAWLIGGILSTGLCASFAIGGVISETSAGHLAPYVDPAILIVLALGLVPFPIFTIRRASSDILQIAPTDLDRHVRALAEDIAARHGFIDCKSHVMRVGRAQFIEIGFVAASRDTTASFEELDNIRQEIATAMGGLKPGYWLTVDFTADASWI